LFGWFHVPPTGRARGGVVLCLPIGDEERRAYLTFRKLAEALTAQGFAVLRFSYDGTGDSAGDLGGPDRVRAWVASIAAAVEVVREAGAEHVTAIGMRMGATLITHAAAMVDLDAVVLWDPCTGGREFIRYQQALLASLSGPQPADGMGVETPGFLFPEALVEELSRLDLRPVDPPGLRTLVLVRSDRPGKRRLAGLFGEPSVDRIEADDQEELLDVPPLSAVVPQSSIERIASWLDTEVPDREAPITVPRADTAVVATDDHGRTVIERAVRLGEVGLCGIVTEPSGGGSGPWMVFLNVATEHHIGPGRLWVELAREWAGHGLRSIRFDVSGVGDSPVHPGQTEGLNFSTEWLEDVPMVAAALSPSDPSDVAFVGLCSGGYSAMEGALSVHARAAYVINPAVSSFSMNRASDAYDPRRRAFRPLPVFLAKLAVRHGRTAWWLWRAFCQIAVWQAPMSVPAVAVREGIEVLVIVGEEDADPFRRCFYWRWLGERRLRRTGRFTFAVVPDVDHPLLFGEGRRAAAALLTSHVLSRVGLAAASAYSDSGRPDQSGSCPFGAGAPTEAFVHPPTAPSASSVSSAPTGS
jgi:alpha-beta hydrolase superfamily lysophospholipase